MSEAKAGRRGYFEDHRMWRLLMAQSHPDAGGNHELFLFICALREELGLGRRLDDGASDRAGPETYSSLGVWRSRMGSWASRNREALRGGLACRGATDLRPWRRHDPV